MYTVNSHLSRPPPPFSSSPLFSCQTAEWDADVLSSSACPFSLFTCLRHVMGIKGYLHIWVLAKKKKWNTPNQIPLSHCMKTPTDIWPLSWMGICTISIHSHIRFLCSHGYLSVPAPISNDGIVNTQVGALIFVPLSGMMLWPAMQGHFALIFMTYTFFLQSKNI